MRLENPLQIKLSTGIKRDKNGMTDSRDIALYAHRYMDMARRRQLPEASLRFPELLFFSAGACCKTDTYFQYRPQRSVP